MRVKKNKKGLNVIEFKDFYGEECTMEETSFTGDRTLWIGCNNANPKFFTVENGWKPVHMPEKYVANTKMHLSRKQVEKMLPHLIKFVETGHIK